MLRVAVQGGGCSGFEYALGFDRGPRRATTSSSCTASRSSSTRSARRTCRAPRSTSSTRSRRPASRSTTRTPSRRAAAATPSRWKRARAPRRARRRLRLRLLALAPLVRVAFDEHVSVDQRRFAWPSSAPARPASTPPGHCSRADLPVEVDLIERLPTPWGLVRLGVAPDHPKIKAVSRAFEKIAAAARLPLLRQRRGRPRRRRTTSSPRLYDAVVYAVGAQTDRRLGHPGEDLPGSWPATEFVAWYNGHPDFQELDVRPLRRARGRGRQRQRRASTSPGCSRSTDGGARADRHDRRGDRGDRRLGHPRDRDARPPRARRRRRSRRPS